MSAGTKLGRYELVTLLATGGMGEIFLARFEGAAGFEKLCVVKRILPHLAGDARFRAMLIGEARIAANMSHANICHVYELAETDQQLYLVMEYLEGVTLLQLLGQRASRDAQLELGFVAGVIQQVCEGLHYAHEHRGRAGAALGVVHRDVTPSNLVLTESGVVKIVDFGIAKVQDAQGGDAGEGQGKFAYMAPEQLRGAPLDRRADLFSLGVVVFEMLTCRRLFHRKSDALTVRAVLEPAIVDVRQYRPDAPAALDAVLCKALARDPAERFATARQLGAALLDAFGAIRPWRQAEVGELVRAAFADELRLRSTEVAAAIRRSAAPVLAEVRAAPEDTVVVAVPLEPVAVAPVIAEPPTPAIATPPAPAIATPPAPAIATPPAPAIATPPEPVIAARPELVVAAARPRRPRLWPYAAIAGAAAAALAIGLSLGGSPRADAARAVEPLRASEPYAAAIRAHGEALDQCVRDHAEPLPAGTRAVIKLGHDGHAIEIAIEPALTERSPLARCVRGVLQGVAFPAAPDGRELALGLAIRR